ncbi:hypothetical protein [Listeria floridensis]|nr:hypothetical protein [Listeria floridensis]
MLFHLIWEANQRYILIFTPIMLLSALAGLRFLTERLFEKGTVNVKKKWDLPILAVSAIIFAVGLVTVGANYGALTQDKHPIHDYQAKQDYAYMRVPVNDRSIVAQTFAAKDAFNTITLKVLEQPDPARRYELTLYDEGTGEILRQIRLTGDEFAVQAKQIQFAKPVSSKSGRYKIKVIETTPREQARGRMLSFGRYNNHKISLYPAGQLYLNGKAQPDVNLGFSVSTEKQAPLMTVTSFAILISILTVITILLWLSLLKVVPKKSGRRGRIEQNVVDDEIF